MARLKQVTRAPVKVDAVPRDMLPVYGLTDTEQIRRHRALDAWYEEHGLGDRRADRDERKRLLRAGLDAIGALYEDPRKWLMRDLDGVILEPGVVTTHERFRADGTPRETVRYT